MPVIHLAGPDICIGSKHIQRCIVCGECLIQEDLTLQMVPTSRVDFEDLPHYKQGHLIKVDRNCTVDVGELAPTFESQELPKDFCLELVEFPRV